MDTQLFTITVVVPVVPATDIQVAWAQTTWTAPVAAGTVMGTLTVLPANWNGALVAFGPDANFFSIVGRNIVTASDMTEARTYSVGFRATP